MQTSTKFHWLAAWMILPEEEMVQDVLCESYNSDKVVAKDVDLW